MQPIADNTRESTTFIYPCMCHSESGRWCYRINPQEKPIWIIYTFYNEDMDQNNKKRKIK